MYTSALLLGAVAVLLDTASAHGFVKGVNVKGTFTNGSDPVWYYYAKDARPQTAGWDALNQDTGFVEPNSAGTADVNCHKTATAGRLYANVNAGDTIEFAWNTWSVIPLYELQVRNVLTSYTYIQARQPQGPDHQ
jgi:cellulase